MTTGRPPKLVPKPVACGVIWILASGDRLRKGALSGASPSNEMRTRFVQPVNASLPIRVMFLGIEISVRELQSAKAFSRIDVTCFFPMVAGIAI